MFYIPFYSELFLRFGVWIVRSNRPYMHLAIPRGVIPIGFSDHVSKRYTGTSSDIM